jgi:DNA-binding transcriptional ArsR family regulator
LQKLDQIPAAVEALGALAHKHRLAVFRILVQAGKSGKPASDIAEALNVPNSSLSFHLSHLARAGLVLQTRQGRSLIYTANYSAVNTLVAYLMENCCEGIPCGTDVMSATKPGPSEEAA